MKKIMLLLVLMMASGLGGERRCIIKPERPRAPRERGLAHDPCTKMALNISSTRTTEKNHRNEKRLLRAGPTNEVEVKRLKLMFLLMMSLGSYRTPVH